MLFQYETGDLAPTAATSLHLRALAAAWGRAGHQVRLLTIRGGRPHISHDGLSWEPFAAPPPAPSLIERALRRLQSTLHLPYLNYFESRRFAAWARAALGDCDLLYERFWIQAYGGLLAAQALNIPIFYEVNGDLVVEYGMLGIDLSPGQWRVIHALTRWMYRRAGRVITVSETLRQRTLARYHLPEAQVTTVSNGADLENITAAPDALPPELAARLDAAVGPLVVFVGNFKPWHGLDLLLDAFAGVADPTARLLLVGDGPERAALEGQAARLGLGERLICSGRVPHATVAALLRRADVAVLNPRQTPASLAQSPLKLFEYLAAGLAILGPRTPNIAALVHDEETALLVAPDDAAALRAGLDRLLADSELRARLGQAAAVLARTRYSWERAAAELETIFRAELERRGPAAAPAAAPGLEPRRRISGGGLHGKD
jgi:glycosyltransferase involved in cell wall biosynthesis